MIFSVSVSEINSIDYSTQVLMAYQKSLMMLF
jgi:hypothetical protein